MKTLKFKCKLTSDIIINTTAATEGEQTTLDFIPGNNFLGIVARQYDKFNPAEQMEIFHSGKVRFGDAHPTSNGSNVRSLHVPATLFFPKGKDRSEELYAFQGYDRSQDKSNNDRPAQLKQCRNGYYEFSKKEGKPTSTKKSFAIKSAYDRANRRAEDSKMYGYESLDKGQEFLFEVEVDNDSLVTKIKDSLVGLQRVGRSRTAQYGLVEISEASFKDFPSQPMPLSTIRGSRMAVYADSRLIFLDDNGQPTFCPTAHDLGFNDGTIDWDLCQVRTFQYAPWNGKRQTRDSDRCGIEKGSVFFVIADNVPAESAYIGSYRNEGFGRVIYNPDFLRSGGGNGEAVYTLLKDTDDTTVEDKKPELEDTPLLNYVKARKEDNDKTLAVLKKVNDFVKKNGVLFKGAAFASQWGSIRKIAMAHPTKEGIMNELFYKKEIRHHYPSPNDPKEEDRLVNIGYLEHGVAAKKWKEQGRADKLRKFINSIDDEAYVQQAVVNLASEMAKICKRNGNN